MVEPQNAERVIAEFYAELVEVLPINELLAVFRANKILCGNHKTKFKSLSTQKEKARYFLDEVIKPGLNVGRVDQFKKMISVMKSSDDSTVKHLAKQMLMCSFDASDNGTSSDDSGM